VHEILNDANKKKIEGNIDDAITLYDNFISEFPNNSTVSQVKVEKLRLENKRNVASSFIKEARIIKLNFGLNRQSVFLIFEAHLLNPQDKLISNEYKEVMLEIQEKLTKVDAFYNQVLNYSSGTFDLDRQTKEMLYFCFEKEIIDQKLLMNNNVLDIQSLKQILSIITKNEFRKMVGKSWRVIPVSSIAGSK